MTRKDTILALKKYFDIRELVCPHTYTKFGEVTSWQFFDTLFLENLLILRRDVLQVPCIVNDWHKGGIYSQRGFRCNVCQLCKDKTLANQIYLTAHANGGGIDIVSDQMTAQQMRGRIKDKQHLFTCNFRVEKGVTWLHFDIYDPGNNQRYNEF